MTMEMKMIRMNPAAVRQHIRQAGLLIGFLFFLAVGSPLTSAPALADIADCPGELGEKMNKSGENYYIRGINKLNEDFDTIRTNQARYPLKGGRGFIKDKWCLGRVTAYLEELKELWKMLNGEEGDLEGWVRDKVKELLAKIKDEILNAVCEYALTAIDIVLESICLPLPDVPRIDFTFEDLTGISCSGISAADYIQIDPAETYQPGADVIGTLNGMYSSPLTILRPSRTNGTTIY